MGRAVAFAVVAVVVALAPVAAAQRQTTAPNVFVTVNITLTGSKVIVSPKTAPRGSDARLVVHNVSKKPQVFSFNYNYLGGGVHSGFQRVFKPGERSVLLLYLSDRGVLPYYSGSSFDHAKPGSRGHFVVGFECALCNQDA